MRDRYNVVLLCLGMVWLIAAVVLCAISATLMLVYLPLVGVACYIVGGAVRRRLQPDLPLPTGTPWAAVFRHAVVIAAIVIVSIFSCGVCLVFHFSFLGRMDPIGNASGVSQTCQLSELSKQFNTNDDVAVVRAANCPGPFSQGLSFYLVFVHKRSEISAQGNLVFEYVPGYAGNVFSPPPSVRWTDDNTVYINAPGVLERIITRKDAINGFKVTYAPGKL